jgi:ABC-type phosphate transport system substrate-binding protein
MSRTHLLGAVSAVALACLSGVAYAQESTTAITGGGSTLAEFDYFTEFATFNASQAAGAATFANINAPNANDTLYWPAGSGSGQSGFLNNDITCDANKVTGANGAACSNTPGGANSVDYGASDATLSASQISGWSTSIYGQSAAGNLIQLPSMGVGIAIPVVNAKVKTNGGITLSDADLCGIFSGKFTDWSQTSAYGTGKKAGATLASGAITVVYRSDGSGTSFLTLNHFAKVCNTTNSNFTFPITPSTTFTSVFKTVPANFVGESGSSGVASYLANGEATAPATPVTSAIGYISPDFTTVDPNSSAVLANGAKSPLVVAMVASTTKGYLPTVTNIENALNHAASGTTLTAPTTASAGANPNNWVPLIQTVSTGYPIVGYTTFDFAQCYASPVIATGIINFLKDHYSTTAAYATTLANNGFVAIASTGAKVFSTPITKAILSNTDKWNIDINDATTCKGKTGR